MRNDFDIYPGQPGFNPSIGYIAKYEPENLVAGDFKNVKRDILFLKGQGKLPRGSLLGRISKVPELPEGESRDPEETKALEAKIGKFVLSLPNANDGSETPVCILAENQDTEAKIHVQQKQKILEDMPSVAYMSGEFLKEGVYLGDDDNNKHDLDSWDIQSTLHMRSIFLERSIEPLA